MNVRPLNADVNNPKSLTSERRHNRLPHCVIRLKIPQAFDFFHRANRDLHRFARLECEPSLVRLARPLALGRPAGALALTAPKLTVLVALPELALDVSLAG